MYLSHDQAAHAKAMGWNPEQTFAVTVTDIWISRDVQISIGRQVKALCISFDLPYSMLRDRLVQNMFWHEGSGRLGIMIGVQDSNVESIYLEIPEDHWGFREDEKTTQ